MFRLSGYVPCVVVTITSTPPPFATYRVLTKVTRHVPLVEKELHTPSDHMCFDEFVLPILYLTVYGFDGSWLIYSFSHYIVCPPTFGFDYPFGIFKLFMKLGAWNIKYNTLQ